MEDAQDFLNIEQVLDKDHFYINEEVCFSRLSSRIWMGDLMLVKTRYVGEKREIRVKD